jgi:DNA-binding response OmpR family regulator
MFALNPPMNEKSKDDRRHILVIDDDPLFRSLIVAVLRKDFRVSVSSDGAEGFHAALDDKPDVTVLDLQMPGWDGLKTLQTFRTHPRLACISHNAV